MKTSIFLFVAICTSFAAAAQQAAFASVALQKVRGHDIVKFTPVRDANVRNYRIEASNDSANFEVVAILSSKGNVVFANGYSYDVSAFGYCYYRVGQVTMGGQMPYSATVGNKSNGPAGKDKDARPIIVTGNSIAGQ